MPGGADGAASAARPPAAAAGAPRAAATASLRRRSPRSASRRSAFIAVAAFHPRPAGAGRSRPPRRAGAPRRRGCAQARPADRPSAPRRPPRRPPPGVPPSRRSPAMRTAAGSERGPAARGAGYEIVRPVDQPALALLLRRRLSRSVCGGLVLICGSKATPSLPPNHTRAHLNRTRHLCASTSTADDITYTRHSYNIYSWYTSTDTARKEYSMSEPSLESLKNLWAF